MGRENATAGQAELKLRLGDDQRSQVLPQSLTACVPAALTVCIFLHGFVIKSLARIA